MFNDSVLECQDCGEIILRLSDAEAQKVANNPYNFVVWCESCRRQLRKQLFEEFDY